MTTTPPTDEEEVAQLLAKIPLLRAEIGKVIIGQQAVVEELLTAFLAGGHCLLEGLPGLGKTLLIRTLAQAVDLVFHRIQFTPDLMPSDIIGTEVLEEDHATGRRFFQFNKGPLFGQIVLADEINRTPPKTQSALLEAMQEGSVTYGGKTYDLERPFFVLATQNPIEQAGTYPLPEAQLDRFLLYVRIGYPDETEEYTMLARTTGKASATVAPVMTAGEVRRLQAMAREVAVSDELLRYVARWCGRPGQVAAVHRKMGALGSRPTRGSGIGAGSESPRVAGGAIRRDARRSARAGRAGVAAPGVAQLRGRKRERNAGRRGKRIVPPRARAEKSFAIIAPLETSACKCPKSSGRTQAGAGANSLS